MTRPDDHRAKNRRKRRGLRYALFALSGIVLLILLALGFTQTPWFRDYVRNKIVAAANDNLEATLRIESLHGNLYSDLTLKGITLTQASDTLLAVDAISARYNFWQLIKGSYRLDSLTIMSPRVSVRQDSNGNWNWQQVTAPDTSATPVSQNAAPTITIAALRIADGTIAVDSPDTLLAGTIAQLNCLMSGTWSALGATAQIRRLSLAATMPALSVPELAIRGNIDKDVITIDSLSATTTRNRLTASGQADLNEPLHATLTFAADTLDLSEFSGFTGGYQPHLRPNVDGTVTINGDSTQADIHIGGPRQTIGLSGWLKGLTSSSTTDSVVSYDLRAQLQSVSLSNWLPDSSTTGRLTGSMHVVGTGLDPATTLADVDAEFGHSSFDIYTFDTLSVHGRYSEPTTNITVNVSGRYGIIDVEGELSDVLQNPGYNLRVDLRRVNLSALPTSQTLATNLNGQAKIDGHGFNPDSLTAHTVITLYHSRLGESRLDTVFADVRYRTGTLTIDTLGVRAALGTAYASGTLGLDRKGTLNVGGTINDISEFSSLANADTLRGDISFNGMATGRLDSLSFDGMVNGAGLRYDDLLAESGVIAIKALYTDSLEHADFDAHLQQVSAYEFPIDSVNAAGKYNSGVISSDMDVAVDPETNASASFTYQSDTVSHIRFSALDITHSGLHWRAAPGQARVDLYDDRVEVNDVRLIADNAAAGAFDTATATISIDGVYRYDSTQAFQIGVEKLDVATVRDLADVQSNINGTLSGVAHTSGSILNPSIDGHAMLSSGDFNGYTFDSLNTSFSYADTTVLLLAELHVHDAESLTVAGTVPLAPLLDTLPRPADTGLDLRVRSYGFTLGILRSFGYTIEQAQGDLQLDLHVERSLANPSIIGTLAIDNGSVNAPQYGINYGGISAKLEFDSSTITLDHLLAKRDKGTLTAKGQIRYANGIASGTIDAGHITLDANKFYLVRHRHYQVEISANATLDGDPKAPTYGGTVTVLRSNFYLPAFSESAMGANGDQGELPMLVAATRDTTAIADTIASPDVMPADTLGRAASQIVQNLRGRLTVKFPRNTWLYDPDMRVEIAGELEVVKESPVFELFGTIDVVRGYYDLYGRRFTIKEGTLTFEGGDSLNPKIAINAVYNFRTPAREKKQLVLNIGGRAETPELQFSLDDAVISEGDAVSYLLFGQNLDALTSGQRKAVIGEGSSKTDLARGAITNLLAGKLTQTLGKEFSLDVIEINAQSDWRSASFLVGKYLTTDLFVSYQRGVGTARDQDEIVPEIVTLEYELSRHLFFQLVAGDARSSGFDVIVKFDTR